MTQRIALVTGGTRGIGAEASKALKQKGYKVIANYNSNTEAAEKFQKETDIEVLKFDVSKFKDVQEAIQHIIDTHGSVDVLINNAGITRDIFLHKMDEDAWDSVINTNLKSAFNLSRSVMPYMREKMFGRIVNISSINAQKGQIGQANYCAAKAGLIGLTKAIALEGARKNVTANVVAPGYVETDMTKAIPENILGNIVQQIPVGRMGRPQEIGSLVSYLASEEASFITGSVIAANGGHYM